MLVFLDWHTFGSSFDKNQRDSLKFIVWLLRHVNLSKAWLSLIYSENAAWILINDNSINHPPFVCKLYHNIEWSASGITCLRKISLRTFEIVSPEKQKLSQLPAAWEDETQFVLKISSPNFRIAIPYSFFSSREHLLYKMLSQQLARYTTPRAHKKKKQRHHHLTKKTSH